MTANRPTQYKKKTAEERAAADAAKNARHLEYAEKAAKASMAGKAMKRGRGRPSYNRILNIPQQPNNEGQAPTAPSTAAAATTAPNSVANQAAPTQQPWNMNTSTGNHHSPTGTGNNATGGEPNVSATCPNMTTATGVTIGNPLAGQRPREVGFKCQMPTTTAGQVHGTQNGRLGCVHQPRPLGNHVVGINQFSGANQFSGSNMCSAATPPPALPVHSFSTPSLTPQQCNQPRKRRVSHTPPVPELGWDSSSWHSSSSNSPENLRKMQSQGQQGQGAGDMPLAHKPFGFQTVNQAQQQGQQAPALPQQMLNWGANSVINGGNTAANFGTLARTGPPAAAANNVAAINPTPGNMGPGKVSKRRREGGGTSSCKRQRRSQGEQTPDQLCQPQIQQQPQQQPQQQTQPQLYQQQQQQQQQKQSLPLDLMELEILNFCMASNNNNNNNNMPAFINPSLLTLPQGQTQLVPAVDWGLEDINLSAEPAVDAPANNNFDGLPIDDLVAQMTSLDEGMFAASDAGVVTFPNDMPVMDQGLSGSGNLLPLPTQAAAQAINAPVVDEVTLAPDTLLFPFAGPRDPEETQRELCEI
ncbi:hypothetical protein N3K66_006460 [Trichothecium roseum]|uniref:Uncharacterized protein n=1 Tax=Trichothecium roseum TaxID=47278 RepID=A0ACC0UVD4_9HYPO|nr:hypothetical protein N3K66_006460 [Trichothecium roseum]